MIHIAHCKFHCLPSEGIAWDWVNQKLYWTDKDNDTISVYDPVRNIHKVLLSTGLGSQPRGIAVDPNTRYVRNESDEQLN